MNDANLGYTVRECRGHWHVCYGDMDIAVDGDPFKTRDAAQEALQGLVEAYWSAHRQLNLRNLLNAYTVRNPVRYGGGGDPSREAALAHIAWMCTQIPELHQSKANRWIGFIQGVLWMTGQRTIDELREESRGIA